MRARGASKLENVVSSLLQLCPIRGKTKIHGDIFPVPSSL